MRVTLRHFALIRETIGLKSEEREFNDGETIGGLYDAIASEFPPLAPLKRSVMMMANEGHIWTEGTGRSRKVFDELRARWDSERPCP